MISAKSTIGPYMLIRKLGQGGFGEVWLAERRSELVTTKVAVKLPFDNLASLDLVRREATIWALASGHPNVLPIIEADVFDGQIAIVSEFAPEGSLQKRLSEERRLSIPAALDLTIAVLNGLAYLHSKGIIHRDLKPANIMLQSGSPRLTDFGISKLIDSQSGSQTTNVSGTFAYMAPEAFDGKQSIQTDVWSAGVLLYQLATGRMPFPQKETTALVGAIMLSEFDRLPKEIPPGIAEVIAIALSKPLDLRFETADEMRDELIRARDDPSFSSSRPNVGRIRQTSNDDGSITVVRPSEHTARRDHAKWIAFAVVFVFAGIGLGWIGFLSRQNEPTNQLRFLSPADQSVSSPKPTRRYIRGARGGCYYLSSTNKKIYVDREMCD